MSDFNLYDESTAKKVRRSEFFDRMLNVLIVVAFVVFSIVQVINTSAIREAQLNGTPTGKKLLRSADQIESCTTPQGDCYKENQAQTAGILGQLDTRMATFSYCILKLSQTKPSATFDDVTACAVRVSEEQEK